MNHHDKARVLMQQAVREFAQDRIDEGIAPDPGPEIVMETAVEAYDTLVANSFAQVDPVAVSIDAGGSKGDAVIATVVLGLSARAAKLLLERLEPDGSAAMDDGPLAEVSRTVVAEIQTQLGDL